MKEYEIAKAAFDHATKNSFPADIIKRLYDDLVKARKNIKRK